MAGPPVRGGAVLIGADGRIREAGPDAAVPAPPGMLRADHPDGILLPGLIDLHTHLELTGLAGLVTSDEFPRWIRALRELKANRTPAEYRAAAHQGVLDCFAAGITTVADTGDSGEVLPALVELGGSGTAYQEVFGPHPDQAPASLAALESRLDGLALQANERVRLGVSPHAPYTVSGPLYRDTARLAARRRLPIAVHLAESPAETQFVARNEGPFAQAWISRGIPPLALHLAAGAPNAARRSPVAWLDHHQVLGPSTLCIHAVQLDREDLELLVDRNVAIAHCPVSNARHGHGSAPLGEILRRGIRVGVGTDSVVSVGRLDMMAELRAARALAALGATETLALATTEAARALGQGGEIGRLAPGHWGDCTVLHLGTDSLGSDPPVEAVLAAGPDDVLTTYVGGRQVYIKGSAGSAA